MELVFKLIFILSIKCTGFVHSASPPLILTPFIEENKINDARKLASVDPSLFLNVTSYSGFLTVNKVYQSNMFFWYFPVPDKPLDKTPWIIWLQGGPGTTSLAGVFDEVGPFEYKKGSGLKMREFSWWPEYSMVFIDNPVGTGFSHSKQFNGFATNMDMYSSQLYSAVRQLVVLFPELRLSELYVAGESYAGHYIPALANKAIQEMDDSAEGKTPFNLQGLIMSNPVLDREGLTDFTTMFYNMGLLDRQGVIAVTPLQEQFTQAVRDCNSSAAAQLHTQLFEKLQVISSSVFENYDHLKDFMEYVALGKVRAALHVGDTKFVFSNMWVHAALYDDFLTLMSPVMNNVLERYRVLIFCSQLGLTTPCAAAAERRRIIWRWQGREQFLRAPRTPWWHNESHAGFVKSGGGFTEVLVLDAGHFAPIDKPEQVQQLVSYFIRGLDLPMPPNYQVDPANTPEYTVPDNQNIVPDLTSTDFRTGFIVSVFINVVFVLGFLALALFAYWRRGEEYSHTPLFGGTF